MHEALIAWWREAGRDLPWRSTRDPWAVLVSELMLQQTQVARVRPRYATFLQRFPTPAACARAAPGEVVRAWAGLGYNRRAVNLHRLATVVVERHGGRLPADFDALLPLPGIGPYTARAVLAYAFEHDVGVVDTNTARVLARLDGRPPGRAGAQRLASSLVPSGRGWAWNQAMVDLGATVCTRRRPRCGTCPLAGACAWRRGGHPEPDPAAPSGQGGRPPFAGSDRQGRGRLVEALRRAPVPLSEVAAVAGWPGDVARARRVAASLVSDGLARRKGGCLTLP